MLAESALCLAFDDNPPTAGQVTTAQAMGDALIARLSGAGHPLRAHRLTPTGTGAVPQAGVEPATFRLGGGCSIR